ncbi:hypothetical protein BU26DRAFT_609183 [Trematosphaeria pertusa]|uniref:Uncharacterized protein n=1 Tax=Trematosphaeria pertusa TaxID=390896 RepID=A0A6A6I0T7_9PLEO|nr:uncharacterized protein BU26DRAFT_609183 [Trematosphaeria pertusa]KAF2243887.1 hypothetical protein BU26DRAFT_609183 [Trematosphaeria pertusa]
MEIAKAHWALTPARWHKNSDPLGDSRELRPCTATPASFVTLVARDEKVSRLLKRSIPRHTRPSNTSKLFSSLHSQTPTYLSTIQHAPRDSTRSPGDSFLRPRGPRSPINPTRVRRRPTGLGVLPRAMPDRLLRELVRHEAGEPTVWMATASCLSAAV